MTPYPSTGMGNSNRVPEGAPNNSYNSVSYAGMPSDSMKQSQQPVETNPAEMAIAEFSNAFNSVQSLLEKPEFAGASKEADLVKRAMQNWLETIVGQLSTPEGQSGESLQNPL